MRTKHQKIIDTIGKTPLIEVEGILAKLETTNPTGSIKDRMAKYLMEMAEQRGELEIDSEIIEVTSGNTGISLAMLSAVKGYRFTAIMPESMSTERRKMIRQFGGEMILTPAEDDMKGAIVKYETVTKRKKVWLPKQFDNSENITAHEIGIGKEIIEQAGIDIDVLIAGVGTGGTLIGIARALRKINSRAKIVAVEPEESAVLSGKQPKLHKIQGIGEGFIPKILKDNLDLIDEVVTIKSNEAIDAQNYLSERHGILVGTSSGANFLAAKKIKKSGQKVVTVFPDRGERYLSEIN